LGSYYVKVFSGPLEKYTSFTLEVTTPSCPVTTAVSGTADGESVLSTLYRLRNEVMLPNPEKKEYSDLFYKHSGEATSILLLNGELRSRVATMLSRFLPVFKASVEGRPVVIRNADVRDIEALIRSFMDKGSQTLRSDLETTRQRLRDGSLLAKFGIRVGD
jgi:hypothetical protein